MQDLSDTVRNELKTKKILISVGNEVIVLNIEDIIFLQKMKNNMQVISKLKVYEVKNTALEKWEEKLKHSKFFRCHKSIIVNLEYVTSIISNRNNTYEIKMEGWKEILPVSREKVKELKNYYEGV